MKAYVTHQLLQQIRSWQDANHRRIAVLERHLENHFRNHSLLSPEEISEKYVQIQCCKSELRKLNHIHRFICNNS